MSEPIEAPQTLTSPPSADVNGQLIVSLAIVATLACLGGGLLIAACITKEWTQAGLGVATIIGVLGNSLTAPTGVGNVLRASKVATETPKP